METESDRRKERRDDSFHLALPSLTFSKFLLFWLQIEIVTTSIVRTGIVTTSIVRTGIVTTRINCFPTDFLTGGEGGEK